MATNQLEIVWTQASRLPPAELAQLIQRAAEVLARQPAPAAPQPGEKKLSDLFGTVSLGYPTGADNESIDADLAREYADNHEDEN